MYQLYHAGKFGNMHPTWPTLDAYEASGFAEPIALRYKGKHGGAWVAYDVQRPDVAGVVASWVAGGADRALIMPGAAAPDGHLILNAEVMRSSSYIDLRYSKLKLPMRTALAQGERHASGVAAMQILRAHLDPASLDDLFELLGEYDDAVIEFSVWACTVGNARGRNTIFWEIRRY